LSGLLPPEWRPGPIGTVRRSVSLGECGLVCTSGVRIRPTIISRISRAHAQCLPPSSSPCAARYAGQPFQPPMPRTTPEIPTTRANKLHSLNSGARTEEDKAIFVTSRGIYWRVGTRAEGFLLAGRCTFFAFARCNLSREKFSLAYREES